MKKILLLCLLGFVFTATAQSDDDSGVTIKPGLRGGLNLAKLTQTGFDYKTDFYAGGFVAMKFTRFYTLQPEITYSRQGSKGMRTIFNEQAQVFVNSDEAIDISYLSFAIINKFTFNDQLNVHFGPTMDFQTDANVYTNSDVDLAFVAGIGYTLPMGLTIEARVKKGIIDVLESDDFSNFEYVEDYNTNLVFQFGLSYSFDMTGTTK